MNWTDITWSAFLQPHELFMVRPPAVWELRMLYVVFLDLLLLVGVVTPFLKKQLRDEARKPLISVAWTNVILGVILFYLRNSGVPVLGMDIWRLVQYIGLIIWTVLYVRHLRTTVRGLSLQEEVAARRAKYLPKPKAKK